MQPFTFFVSYRRQDTAPIALLLKHEIEKRLQFVRVSVDVEDIGMAEVFPERIGRLIDGAHAVIALIGRQWMPRADTPPPQGNAPDWVAHELALARSTPLTMPADDRFGLTERMVLPLFVDCPRSYAPFRLPAQASYMASLNAEAIDYAGWPSAIGPLIERLAVRLSLKKRPDADEYPKPNPSKARTQPLSDTELTRILSYDDYEGWYVDNFGNAEVRYLTKTFRFRGFDQAARFMAMVADHCRVLDHHPEWRNVFDHVTVSLTTWDAQRRVTIYDLNLALYMNMAAKAAATPSQG